MTVKPRLLDPVREKIRLKHYRIRTDASLCGLDQALHPVPRQG
jgi:hypothetical protein